MCVFVRVYVCVCVCEPQEALLARGLLKRDPTLQSAVYRHFVALTARKPPGKRTVTLFQYKR